MSKLSNYSQELKAKMKADYLAGIPMKIICKKVGLTTKQGVYYYIRPLSPEDRATHVLNFYKNLEAKKKEAQNG